MPTAAPCRLAGSTQDDLCQARPAQWDGSLVEFSSAVKTRVPAIVEERCKGARHRANCGLIPAAKHAWASADTMLHLWDYRRETPDVVVLPADSTIVMVAACPPRPGVFGAAVDLLLVVCTRASVSLWGLQLPSASASSAAAPPLARAPAAAAPAPGAPAPPTAPAAAAVPSPAGAGDSLRLIALEGFAARTDGIVFHTLAHTDDGHILLACGTPQIYELAYSASPSWFHSKCRLVQHALGLRSRMRDFFSFSTSTLGRIRLLACATHDYVVAVDDASTIRLFGIRDHAVHRAESVAVVQELASLTVEKLSEQLFAQAKVHLASRNITHVFPALGLDGHLRVHVVTASSERLLLLCSRGRADEDASGAARVQYGFWLQHATESRLGHGGSSTNSSGPLVPWGSSGSSASWLAGAVAGGSAGRRLACFEEAREPCAYSCGVWVAASHRPGVPVTEVGISVRLGDAEGSNASMLDSQGARSIYKALTLDSSVLDIVEEADTVGGRSATASRALEGEPTAFRGNRSFALLLQHSVQVFRLNFKADTLGHPPTTAAECCRYLVSLTSPSDSGLGRGAADLAIERGWGWTFDDVQVPRFEDLRRCMQAGQATPALGLGKWLSGLLRFLALVLRPVWSLPLVAPIKGQKRGGEALGLAVDEAAVQRLLARLRPALRFARQGLDPLPSAAARSSSALSAAAAAPASAAARSRLYSQERVASSEGAAQAQRTLRGVLDVAERARQVLGLARVLHAQRSAYRVLQSSIVAGPALESLLSMPLSSLVATPEALAPVVQLCTALVVESGLATPTAGIVFDAKGFPQPLSAGGAKAPEGPPVAGDLCRDLEEQSPAIFAQVDSRYMQTRLTAGGGGSSAEVLRRYAQCVSAASQEDQWASLASGLKAIAAEDPRAAVDVCVEKLQQLQQPEDAAAGVERAKALLGALLEVLALDMRGTAKAFIPKTDTRTLVEHLLAKTASLKLRGAAETEGAVPAVHGIILDYLLCNKQMHKVLEALLSGSSADVEAFLTQRCSASRAAGDLLWRHHLRQGRHAEASEVLVQLAERADADIGLSERTRWLDLAVQAAGRALPQTKALVDKLKAQLEVAARVQVPLQHELRLLSQDGRAAPRWREAAQQRRQALERLTELQALYEVAFEFGLWHLVLVIADISSNVQEREQISLFWVNLFFPPTGSPYTPGELVGGGEALRQHGIFPLLMVRKSATFVVQGDQVQPLPLTTSARVEDFRVRTERLLTELSAATQAPSSIWNPNCIAVLLEYCNCLWHSTFEPTEARSLAGTADSAAGLDDKALLGGGAAAERAWVALSVLTRRPFHFTHLSLLRFYSDMLADLPTWLRDLEAQLPPDSARRRPVLKEDDLRVHLGEVALIVLDTWVAELEAAKPGENALAEFCRAFPTVEGALARVRAQLEAVRAKAQAAAAKQLLQKLGRLEAAGRKLQGRGSPLSAPIAASALAGAAAALAKLGE